MNHVLRVRMWMQGYRIIFYALLKIATTPSRVAPVRIWLGYREPQLFLCKEHQPSVSSIWPHLCPSLLIVHCQYPFLLTCLALCSCALHSLLCVWQTSQPLLPSWAFLLPLWLATYIDNLGESDSFYFQRPPGPPHPLLRMCPQPAFTSSEKAWESNAGTGPINFILPEEFSSSIMNKVLWEYGCKG